MIILGIDPGPEQSGWALYDTASNSLRDCGVFGNEDIIENCFYWWVFNAVAIEMIHFAGVRCGQSTFDTVVWIGRFYEALLNLDNRESDIKLIFRRDVKLQLAGTIRVKDADIRNLLLEKIGPKGTKAKPGPLYGIKSHAWAALAVAVTLAAQEKTK